MIDLTKLAGLMESHGFVNVTHNSEHMGVRFHIVAEGKAGLVKQTVLVSCVPRLDQAEASRIEQAYMTVDSKSKSFWVGKVFTYCVFADAVDDAAGSQLLSHVASNDLKGANLAKGGGGAMIIVDTSSRRVGSHIPRAVGVKKLQQVIAELLPPTSPEAP